MKKIAVLAILLGSAASTQQPAPDPGLQTMTQVAIVCRDIEATSKRWAAVLGVDPPQIRTTRPGSEVKMMYRGKPSNGRAKLAFLKAGQVTVELIQPVDGGSSWQEFLDAGGEGVQHVAFQVQNPQKTLAYFSAMGAPVLHQGRYDGDNGSYFYVDSKGALGVTVELLHSEPKK
jgi:catechol 2,3-dioxygenase-like lactoylglutathione lyase family enzyme